MDPQQGQVLQVAGGAERAGVSQVEAQLLGQLPNGRLGQLVVTADEHRRGEIAVAGVGHVLGTGGVERLDHSCVRSPTSDLFRARRGGFKERA